MSWIFAPGSLFSGRNFVPRPGGTVWKVGLAFAAGAALAGVASKLPTKAEQEERAAERQQAKAAGAKSTSRPIRVIPITRNAEKPGAKDGNTGAVTASAAASNSSRADPAPRLPASIPAPPPRPESASKQADATPNDEDRSATAPAASDERGGQPEVQSTRKRRAVKSRSRKRNRAYARDDWPTRPRYDHDERAERSAWRAYDDDRPRYRSFWEDDRGLRYRSRRANRYDERGPPRFFLFD